MFGLSRKQKQEPSGQGLDHSDGLPAQGQAAHGEGLPASGTVRLDDPFVERANPVQGAPPATRSRSPSRLKTPNETHIPPPPGSRNNSQSVQMDQTIPIQREDTTHSSFSPDVDNRERQPLPRIRRYCAQEITLGCMAMYLHRLFYAAIVVAGLIIVAIIILATTPNLKLQHLEQRNRYLEKTTLHSENSPILLCLMTIGSAVAIGPVLNALLFCAAFRRNPNYQHLFWTALLLLWVACGCVHSALLINKGHSHVAYFPVGATLIVVLFYALPLFAWQSANPLCLCRSHKSPSDYIKRIRRTAGLLNKSAQIVTTFRRFATLCIMIIIWVLSTILHTAWFFAQAGLALNMSSKLDTDEIRKKFPSLTRFIARAESSSKDEGIIEKLSTKYAPMLAKPLNFITVSIILLVYFIWLNQVLTNTVHSVLGSKFGAFDRGRREASIRSAAFRRICWADQPSLAHGSCLLAVFHASQCFFNLVRDADRLPADADRNRPSRPTWSCCRPKRSTFSYIILDVPYRTATPEKKQAKPATERPNSWFSKNAHTENKIHDSESYILSNHSLIEPMIFFMSLFAGAACVTVNTLYMLYKTPTYFNANYGVIVLPLDIVALFLGFQICFLGAVPLLSVMDTFYIFLATDTKVEEQKLDDYFEPDSLGRIVGRSDKDLPKFQQDVLWTDEKEHKHAHIDRVLKRWYEGAYVKAGDAPQNHFKRSFSSGGPYIFHGWSFHTGRQSHATDSEGGQANPTQSKPHVAHTPNILRPGAYEEHVPVTAPSDSPITSAYPEHMPPTPKTAPGPQPTQQPQAPQPTMKRQRRGLFGLFR